MTAAVPHERVLASWYLVFQQAPLASATFTPEQLADPKVADWWQRAARMPPGSWTPHDIGITTEELMVLTDERPFDFQIAALERRVQEEWCLRRTRMACNRFSGIRAATPDDVTRLLQEVTQALSGRPVESVTHRQAVAALTAQWFQDVAAEKQLLPLPWHTLAHQVSGLPRKRAILIGGRSSEHKTTTARAMAEHVARNGYRALYWTLEDSTADVANRTVSADVPGIRQGELVSGQVPKGYSRIKESIERLCRDITRHVDGDWSQNLRYHDEHHPTLDRVCSYIRAEAARGLDAVFGDFIQLIQPNKDERVSETWWRLVMARLSALAHELNIAMVWTSQIEKTGTKESEGRVPRGIEMPYGSVLRQGAFGVLMVGVVPDMPGKLCMIVDKWKSAKRNISPSDKNGKIILTLDAAHDKLIDKNPPAKDTDE